MAPARAERCGCWWRRPRTRQSHNGNHDMQAGEEEENSNNNNNNNNNDNSNNDNNNDNSSKLNCSPMSLFLLLSSLLGLATSGIFFYT